MYEPPKCRKCGRIISFIPLKSGKKMPVDSFSVHVVPRVDGIIFWMEDGNPVRGRETDRKGPNTVEAYRSHFASCQYADEIQRSREGTRDAQREKIRERIERERAEAAARQEKREARAREEAERQAAQDAQFSLFRRV